MRQLEEMVPMVSDIAAKSTHLSSIVDRLNAWLATSLPAAASSPNEDAKKDRKEAEGAKLNDNQPVATFPQTKPEAG